MTRHAVRQQRGRRATEVARPQRVAVSDKKSQQLRKTGWPSSSPPYPVLSSAATRCHSICRASTSVLRPDFSSVAARSPSVVAPAARAAPFNLSRELGELLVIVARCANLADHPAPASLKRASTRATAFSLPSNIPRRSSGRRPARRCGPSPSAPLPGAAGPGSGAWSDSRPCRRPGSDRSPLSALAVSATIGVRGWPGIMLSSARIWAGQLVAVHVGHVAVGKLRSRCAPHATCRAASAVDGSARSRPSISKWPGGNFD